MILATLLEKNIFNSLTSLGKLWTKLLGEKERRILDSLSFFHHPQKPSLTSLLFSLRSFLKVVLLIGESQERERVLQHFSSRFLQCNPSTYSSSGERGRHACKRQGCGSEILRLCPEVIPLVGIPRVCAGSDMCLDASQHWLAWTGKGVPLCVMHVSISCSVFGMLYVCEKHVGKPMSSSKFVSNLDGMNEGGNFNKDLLKVILSHIYSRKAPKSLTKLNIFPFLLCCRVFITP